MAFEPEPFGFRELRIKWSVRPWIDFVEHSGGVRVVGISPATGALALDPVAAC